MFLMLPKSLEMCLVYPNNCILTDLTPSVQSSYNKLKKLNTS